MKQLDNNEKEYNEGFKQLEEDFEAKLRAEQNERERIYSDRETLVKRHKDTVDMMDQENRREIDELNEKNLSEMHTIKD